MTKNTTLAKRETTAPADPTRQRESVRPLVDVFENDQEVLLIADLPGVVRDDIRIEVDKGLLTLAATQIEDPQGGNLLTGEFRSVDFVRSFQVPDTIDADAIKAAYDKGVLTVHLPKAAAHKPRQIQVQAG